MKILILVWKVAVAFVKSRNPDYLQLTIIQLCGQQTAWEAKERQGESVVSKGGTPRRFLTSPGGKQCTTHKD